METNMSDEDDSEYSEFHEYHTEEQALQDNILALQRVETPDYGFLRPSLAEQQKVGFFGLDRASQTEKSEIIEIKELTDVLQELLQDVATLKRDILFAKQVMTADYESKLQTKALEMYCRINERLEELEKQHEDRVDVVRRAFKQQLADALARMATVYNDPRTQSFDTKLKAEKKKKESGTSKLDDKIKEMQATIQRNESVIQMLKMQLQQYQEREHENHSAYNLSMSPSINPELEELREERAKLEKRVDSLENALDIKEETTNQLNLEIAKLNEQLEKERILIEQQNDVLKHEQRDASAKAEQDKTSTKRMPEMDNQKKELELMLGEQMRDAKHAVSEQAKKDIELMQRINDNKVRELVEQKQKLEDALVKERSKNAQKREEQSEFEKMKKADLQSKNTITKLRKEIERIHKTWEKKFAILQQSLHALKDESFLRQTLQRQAAQLHQASISYASDTPLGILPTNRSPRKQALPEITRHSVKSPYPDKDYISYTVSAPSGRGTGLFSLDENQVMSDDDAELPPGVVPLPAPLHRKPTECGDDSRPSTRSHMIVIPTVEAQ